MINFIKFIIRVYFYNKNMCTVFIFHLSFPHKTPVNIQSNLFKKFEIKDFTNFS